MSIRILVDTNAPITSGTGQLLVLTVEHASESPGIYYCKLTTSGDSVRLDFSLVTGGVVRICVQNVGQLSSCRVDSSRIETEGACA